MAGFELALKDQCGEGELLFGEAERGAKEDFGRPASCKGHESHAFFEVAAAGQKLESFLDKGLWIQRDEAGLVLLDALVVSRVRRIRDFAKGFKAQFFCHQCQLPPPKGGGL